MNITLLCEESFDGIMTAVYDGWVLMNQGNTIKIHPGFNYNPDFFSEYMHVTTNMDKALKVATSIRVKISIEAYMMVFRACSHYSEERGNIIFEFLKIGYKYGGRVTKMLGYSSVMDIMELSRKAVNEAHLFKGFIRFTELKGEVLYSTIEPKCDVLPLIDHHFTERFPEENWIIYDKKRMKALVHAEGKESIIVAGQNMEELVKDLKCSNQYEDLWKVFFDTIAIDSRNNPKCQQTHIPMWYRKNMLEFSEKS